MELSASANEFKKAYMREWRRKNRETQRVYMKVYRLDHKDQIKENNNRYWERKATPTI